MGVRDKYEAHHKVKITDEAVKAAVRLSDRYISDRFLPDKAIDLMDEAASKIRLKNFTAPKNVKTGKTGLTKGYGAAAIYEKHKIENRRSKKLLLSGTSLVMVAINIVMTFAFSDEPVAVFAHRHTDDTTAGPPHKLKTPTAAPRRQTRRTGSWPDKTSPPLRFAASGDTAR